jgi:hypothetical protein
MTSRSVGGVVPALPAAAQGAPFVLRKAAPDPSILVRGQRPRQALGDTGQRAHTAFAARVWSNAGPVVPMGKKSSGFSSKHPALWRQSMIRSRFH